MIKLSCEQATQICDKHQYREASFWEKIKLKLHVLFCKECGKYAKVNSLLTKCFYIHKTHLKNGKHCLKDEEKKVLKNEILKKNVLTK